MLWPPNEEILRLLLKKKTLSIRHSVCKAHCLRYVRIRFTRNRHHSLQLRYVVGDVRVASCYAYHTQIIHPNIVHICVTMHKKRIIFEIAILHSVLWCAFRNFPNELLFHLCSPKTGCGRITQRFMHAHHPMNDMSSYAAVTALCVSKWTFKPMWNWTKSNEPIMCFFPFSNDFN